MSELIRKKIRVEVAQDPPKKTEEPKKEVPKKLLPLYNFPLKGRSVRARNLAEAIKKVNTKE